MPCQAMGGEPCACGVSMIAITALIGISAVTSAVAVISIISKIAVIHAAMTAIDVYANLSRRYIPDSHIISVEYIADMVDRMRRF